MFVTILELKSNLDKYLQLVESEDIFITRNGKIVAKLSNPNVERVEMAKSLLGIIPADITLEETIVRNSKISAVDSIRGIFKDVPDNIDIKFIREEK